MKQTKWALLAFLLLMTLGSNAIPAHRAPVTVRQPDGSQLTLQLYGDEWMHYQTTADGYTVVKDHRGYYVYAHKDGGQLKATAQVAHDETARPTAEQAFLSGVAKHQAPEMSAGMAQLRQTVQQRQRETLAKRRAKGRRAAQQDYDRFKGLVILVQYNDRQFTYDDYDGMINEMLNDEGYSGYYDKDDRKQTYTGSVHDYFADNSGGRFQPAFDIYGPVTIDYSQYDANGSSGGAMLTLAALDAVDDIVDFSKYDGDGDGVVDMIYFIFAGNGANYSGNDQRLYWPHRSIIHNPNATNYNEYWVQKDGVLLYDYASSVELYGWTSYPSSVTIDGIGTICHEFSHVLGLPDFYDTDYSSGGGQSNHPGGWSLMAGGGSNNYGRTPVGYSLYERYSVGFTDEPPTINAAGSYTLDPLYSSETGFRIDSPNAGEFFLFENRQANRFKWDAYLPGSGMLVHRVDLSNESVWQRNTINCNPARNYYEVVRAGGAEHSGTAADVFPGSNNVTTLGAGTTPASLSTWDGKPAQWSLSSIAMTDGIITFSVSDGYVLESLALPETATVGVNMGRTLEVTIVPNINIFDLTWESDDPDVATVDQQGHVVGINPGTCTITVTGDGGITASCRVTVVEMNGCSIAELKAGEEGQEVLLKLADVEVLYAYHGRVYVRDATGAISLNNLGISARQNDRLNGLISVKLGTTNNVPEAMKTDNTQAADVAVSAGSAVVPREVAFDELTADRYSDLVVVRGIQLQKISGLCYAVSGDRRIRVNATKFGSGVASLPANYDGKYYDITGIFGTIKSGSTLMDEVALTTSPTEVETPTSISHVTTDPAPRTTVRYSLSGQRVGSGYKGLVIVNGKVVLMQ